MSERDTTQLFTQAVNVMNGALAKHKDQTPYSQMIDLSEKTLGDRNIGVAVYASEAEHPFDYYTVRFQDEAIQIVSHGKQETDIDWKVSRDYLEKVVENADDYMEHPMKLDWDWLKSRIGLS